MEYGDKLAVVRMYEIMKPMVERYAPMEYDLARQLEAEYGVKLPECRGKITSLQECVGHTHEL